MRPRVAEISFKNQKFSIDSYGNENFIFPFSVPPGGGADSQKGRRYIQNKVRSHAKFGVNRPAGCRESVDKKRTKKQMRQ